MSETCWSILGIQPCSDKQTIRRAYAKLLKVNRPEDDADHYQRIRNAYEDALNGGTSETERVGWKQNVVETNNERVPAVISFLRSMVDKQVTATAFGQWLIGELNDHAYDDLDLFRMLNKEVMTLVANESIPMIYVTECVHLFGWTEINPTAARHLGLDDYRVWQAKVKKVRYDAQVIQADGEVNDGFWSELFRLLDVIVPIARIVLSVLLIIVLGIQFSGLEFTWLLSDSSAKIYEHTKHKTPEHQMILVLKFKNPVLVRKVLARKPALQHIDAVIWGDAIRIGDVDLIRELKTAGMRIDGLDELGQSALHCAVKSGNKDIVALFLEWGLDPNDRGRFRKSPLEMAKEWYLHDITALFEAGLNPTN